MNFDILKIFPEWSQAIVILLLAIGVAYSILNRFGLISVGKKNGYQNNKDVNNIITKRLGQYKNDVCGPTKQILKELIKESEERSKEMDNEIKNSIEKNREETREMNNTLIGIKVIVEQLAIKQGVEIPSQLKT